MMSQTTRKKGVGESERTGLHYTLVEQEREKREEERMMGNKQDEYNRMILSFTDQQVQREFRRACGGDEEQRRPQQIQH